MMQNNIQPWAVALLLATFYWLPAANGQTAAQEPVIYLRATVDHLRLRAQPAKNAAVVVELPEHTQLKFLGVTGGTVEQISLRGVIHNARWYKVAHNEKNVGWVYGGAVAVSSVYLPDDARPSSVKEDFLQITAVSKSEFDKGLANYQTTVLRDTLEHPEVDQRFQITCDNGKTLEFRDTIDTVYDGEESWYYDYIGQLTAIGQYIVSVSASEWDVYRFVDRRTGRIVQSVDLPMGWPELSPNQKWVALGSIDPYESIGGLQILFADHTGIYPAFTVQQPNRGVDQYYWSPGGELFFRWEAIFSAEENQPEFEYYRLKIFEP